MLRGPKLRRRRAKASGDETLLCVLFQSITAPLSPWQPQKWTKTPTLYMSSAVVRGGFRGGGVVASELKGEVGGSVIVTPSLTVRAPAASTCFLVTL